MSRILWCKTETVLGWHCWQCSKSYNMKYVTNNRTDSLCNRESPWIGWERLTLTLSRCPTGVTGCAYCFPEVTQTLGWSMTVGPYTPSTDHQVAGTPYTLSSLDRRVGYVDDDDDDDDLIAFIRKLFPCRTASKHTRVNIERFTAHHNTHISKEST